MGALAVRDARAALREDLMVLNAYAKRAIPNGGMLTLGEWSDATVRLWEAFAIGASFNLSKRDIVVLVLRDALSPYPVQHSKCGCPSCRSRERRER